MRHPKQPRWSRPAATVARPAPCVGRVSKTVYWTFAAAWLGTTMTYAAEPRAEAAVASDLALALSADGARVEVLGAPPSVLAALQAAPPDAKRWQQILSIYVGSESTPSDLPVMGKHGVEGAVIAFTPRFPFRAGLTYRAVFDVAAIEALPQATKAGLERVLALPAARAASAARVAAVYPSGDELPENLLKFYIHFTAPMSRGEAYRRIHILDADNREVPDAFLRLGEELWSPDGRRFTLLFDPARIKRGLRPNLDEGMPLVAGRRYTLLIDDEWCDAAGVPLAEEHRKAFRTSQADEQQPEPGRWRLAAPEAGTREPLVVSFDEPLDHALLQRMIAVRDGADRDVAGEVRVDRGERRWSFTPAKAWTAGKFSLVVDGMLEDLAGNSPGRPFEVANAGDEVGATSATSITLPFEIKAR